MSQLTEKQTLGLAHLLIAIAGDITVSDQGKFVIPANLINEISTLSPQSYESENQSLDFNCIIVPRFGMNQFAQNLELNEKLSRGNIRNTYLYILKNGVDEKGEAIDSRVTDGLQWWIDSKKDNDIEFGNDSVEMSLQAAEAISKGNLDILDGISFKDAHPYIQKIKLSVPKVFFNLQDEERLGNKTTLPQHFIKKVQDMMVGKPDKNDADIATLLGTNNLMVDDTAERFQKETGVDLGPIKEFFIVLLRNKYLDSIKKCVDESGAKISPDFLSQFEAWVAQENIKTMPSIKPVWDEHDSAGELLAEAALVKFGVADNSNNVASSSSSTTQNPSSSINPESSAQVAVQERPKPKKKNPYAGAFDGKYDKERRGSPDGGR